jgi:hypothetical protein
MAQREFSLLQSLANVRLTSMKSTKISSVLWAKALFTTLLSPWKKFREQCQEMRLVWRQSGFKALIAKYGWRFFAIVFCFYLIRDITLYLVLPYMVAQVSAN